MEKNTTVTRKVVCASIKYDNDIIICGARHFDETMCKQINAIDGLSQLGCKQGFIDQFGVFMDRIEALKVAQESGQPLDMKRNSGNGKKLFSEGIY